MDENLPAICKRLQAAIDALDPSKDRDALVWMQGFLAAISVHNRSRLSLRR